MHSHFNIAGTQFPLLEETQVLAGKAVRLLLVPNGPGELDRIVQVRGIQEQFWPYWLEDWTSSAGLAEVLDREDSSTWSGKVLDLGCGAGVLSAWMRVRFGIDPISCDFNFDACRLAALNVGRNGTQTRSGKGKVVCADLRAFPTKAEFGVILAGDILYAKENHTALLTFLSRHLAPRGLAFLADPGRSAAEGFSLAAGLAGFQVETRRIPQRVGNGSVQVYKLNRHFLRMDASAG